VVGLRCAILSFPSSLCRCHVFIIAVTALTVLIAINFTTILNWLILDRCNGLVHRLRSRGLRYAAAIEVVVGIENLEIVRILRVTVSMLNVTIRKKGLAGGDPLLKSSEFAPLVWLGVGGRPRNWWCCCGTAAK
jgi:hypothetical protein